MSETKVADSSIMSLNQSLSRSLSQASEKYIAVHEKIIESINIICESSIDNFSVEYPNLYKLRHISLNNIASVANPSGSIDDMMVIPDQLWNKEKHYPYKFYRLYKAVVCFNTHMSDYRDVIISFRHALYECIGVYPNLTVKIADRIININRTSAKGSSLILQGHLDSLIDALAKIESEKANRAKTNGVTHKL